MATAMEYGYWRRASVNSWRTWTRPKSRPWGLGTMMSVPIISGVLMQVQNRLLYMCCIYLWYVPANRRTIFFPNLWVQKSWSFIIQSNHIQSNLRVETTRNTSGTLWKEPPRIWDVLHVPNHKEYPWINAKPWVFKANGGREVERHSIKEQLHLYQSSILASLSINTGDFRTTGWTYVTIGLEPFWYILAISVIAATNW